MPNENICVSLSASFFTRARCRSCRSGPWYVYKDYNYKPHTFAEMRQETAKKAYAVPQRRTHTYACSRSSFILRENRVSVATMRTKPDDNSVRLFICSCGETTWLYSGDANFVATKRRATNIYPNKNITEF